MLPKDKFHSAIKPRQYHKQYFQQQMQYQYIISYNMEKKYHHYEMPPKKLLLDSHIFYFRRKSKQKKEEKEKKSLKVLRKGLTGDISQRPSHEVHVKRGALFALYLPLCISCSVRLLLAYKTWHLLFLFLRLLFFLLSIF